jgi:hypothetical protein
MGAVLNVDVVYDAVEWLGPGGAWPQHHWEFLEQLLYLGQESGGGLWALGFNERSSICLGEVYGQRTPTKPAA